MITILAGGTGSVKLIRGLASQTRELTVISNIGDNIWLHGLYVCPDIDTVIYGLADILDKSQGWGIRNDSFGFIRQMEMLGEQTWFRLGDRDLATHLLRTNMLKNGKNLSEITEWMRNKYAISTKIIPATDNPVETKIITDIGELHIQEFWVKFRGNPEVTDIVYAGAERSRVNPEAIHALKRSKVIIIAPANPVTSIGPILAIKGLRKELIIERKKIIAVSPLIGERAISGPAIKYMKALKMQNSPVGVAEYYSDFVSTFVISRTDSNLSAKINRFNIKVYETDIMMDDSKDEIRLASYLLKQSKSF
ncbi:MAG: 2-phospho-L-lactate transferase [Nitrososphaeraceae archaeon]|nr:2-phospho-L-lactate transferase [Nitrososphaeraceae archaeon]MBV9669134.1 2-phospho-L-lactate transferase [Nitrososphaeraceae archaeon]